MLPDAEDCKQMQMGTENKSAIVFSMLKCEILSTLGALQQYKHKGFIQGQHTFIPSISLYNLQDRNWVCFPDS